jgi:hypothetical protein
VPPPWLCLNTRRHECVPSVGEHDYITGLEVGCGVLEEAEVVAGCVVEAVAKAMAARYERRRRWPGVLSLASRALEK